MFSDDRKLAACFSIDPTPFPEPSDFHYQHLIPSPETHHPPQKLRPIRSLTHDRPESILTCADAINCCAPPPPPALGFAADLSFSDFHHQFGGADDDHILAALRQIRPAEEFECVFSELKKQVPGLDSTSLSSEDGDDAPDPADGITHSDVKKSRRKKRKKRKRMESFVEDLMMQVMDKQEQMHKQLIEVMERREAERVIRDEAWRRQEIELANREEAIRAQEESRSLALISFIQNMMGGHGIQLPQKPLQSSMCEEHDSEVQSQSKLNNKSWLRSEVQALIALRCAFDYKFRHEGSKISIWQQVSAGLANMGYCRSGRKCMEKWLQINKSFKSSTGNGKTPPENSKSCPYFQELEILYKNGFIN